MASSSSTRTPIAFSFTSSSSLSQSSRDWATLSAAVLVRNDAQDDLLVGAAGGAGRRVRLSRSRGGGRAPDRCVLEEEVATPMMDDMSGSSGNLVRRVDELQRRRHVIGFSFAVVKRYGEDHGGWLGLLIAYYGFFSVYPLLVVFVTVATWVFRDRPEALPTGAPGAVVEAPFRHRRVQRRVRTTGTSTHGPGLGARTVAGRLDVGARGRCGPGPPGHGQHHVGRTAVQPSTVLRQAATAGSPSSHCSASASSARSGRRRHADRRSPPVAACAAAVANIALAAGIVVALYHLTIGTSVRTSDVVPGALITAAATYGITLVGGLYVKHVIARTSGVYGPFASTIGSSADRPPRSGLRRRHRDQRRAGSPSVAARR